MTESLLDAALGYARRGWHVFPCHSPTEGGCSCRKPECTNIGKHPRVTGWQQTSSTDDRQIRAWWAQWPDANIGINCGPSDLVVVDVDTRHGGDESWRDLQLSITGLTLTASVVTPGGGAHYYYHAPSGEKIGNVANSDRFTGPLGAGIDLRAWGGYVIAPPSLHRSGGTYQWEAGTGRVARLPVQLFERLTAHRSSSDLPHVSVAEMLTGVAEGSRDWDLFRLSAKLRYADVPYEWALQLVTAAAAACSPPYPREDAIAKVRSAYGRYEPGQRAILEPTQHEHGLSGRVMIGALIKRGIPAPEFLVANVLVKGYVHLVYGPPGCGKTQLALAWALEIMQSGKPVLFIDEESGENMIAARLQAMGADPEMLDSLLHYYPFPHLGLQDTAALLEAVATIKPAAVFLDALADVLDGAGLDENAAADVTRWMVGVAVPISRDYGATVIILDHAGKGESGGYSRGSGAKKAKTDFSWSVEQTTPFDADHPGRLELRRQKNRLGVLPPRVAYIVGPVGGHALAVLPEVEPVQIEMPKTANTVLGALEVGCKTSAEIGAATGLSRPTIAAWLERLVATGKLRITREAAGRSAAEYELVVNPPG